MADERCQSKFIRAIDVSVLDALARSNIDPAIFFTKKLSSSSYKEYDIYIYIYIYMCVCMNNREMSRITYVKGSAFGFAHQLFNQR